MLFLDAVLPASEELARAVLRRSRSRSGRACYPRDSLHADICTLMYCACEQEASMFYYPCPCGDKFQISIDELLDGEGEISCQPKHHRQQQH